MTDNRSNRIIPPGETISELLYMRDMTEKDLSRKLHKDLQFVKRLLEGNELLTPEIAHSLYLAFGIEDSFWLNLEILYRNELRAISDG